MPGEEEVNFERVTKVYREESGKKTLVALEADFYDKLASYIARLDESANKEAQKDPNSPKALLLQDELRKVRKRRDQIFTYRERKLALLASSRASGAEVDVPNLPAQERGLFEGMVALLGKSRMDAFGGSPVAARAESPMPQSSVARPEAAKKEPERMKVVRAEDTKRVAVPPSLKDRESIQRTGSRKRTWSRSRRRSRRSSSAAGKPGSSRWPAAHRDRSNARPETRIKYAHRIVTRVSETRALHHWHPVLLAGTERAPSTCAGVEGEGVEAAGGASLRRTASTDTDHMHPGRVLSRQVRG